MAQSKYYHNPKTNPHTAPTPTMPTQPSIEIIIPTAHDSPTLDSVIRTHRRQTLQVGIHIIETSYETDRARNIHLRYAGSTTIRVTWQPPRPAEHRCAVITDALDSAIATSRADWILLTHDDVWLKRQDQIAELLNLAATTRSPLVAYEMSPRQNCRNEWRGMPSHTLTLISRHYALENKLRWDITAAIANTPTDQRTAGWPDTETNFGRRCKELKTPIHWIASENNEPHFEDAHIVHRRSLTSHLTDKAHANIYDTDWINQQISRFH